MSTQKLTAFWLGYQPSGPDAPGVGPELGNTPEFIDVVILAFGNLYPANSICTAFLQKANSEDAILAGIAQIRQKAPNAKILLSLIGTPNPKVGWNDGITDPGVFGSVLANMAKEWGLDGFDIDNEDFTFPGQQFIDTVKGMREAMPNKILTLDSYLFDRDKDVIKALADDIDYLNTIAYFESLTSMKELVEQYATVIDPGKISIGVKSAKVGFDQGTSIEDTKALTLWEPPTGAKYGMTLWNLSEDMQWNTDQPNGTWANTIHANLP